MTNPIITRELISMLRTRKAFALQVAVVAVLSLLVVLRWPTDARVNTSGFQAQQVLRVFGYGLMMSVILLAPVFPATSIVREKQRGTLALLLNSPMSPWSILIGKLVSSMGFMLLLLILSMPAAAAAFTMGGVQLKQVLLVYAVLVIVALQYGSIALYVSSSTSSIDSALRITFGLVLFLAVIPLVLVQFIPRDQPMPFAPAEFIQYLKNVPDWADKQEFAWLPKGLASSVYAVILYVVVFIAYLSRFLSPAPAMTAILQDEAVFSAAGSESGGAVWRYAFFAVVSSAVILYLIARRLRPGMLDKARSAGVITDDRSAGAKAYRRFMFLWFFDPQRRSGSIGLANPVMMKEFRTRRFGRAHWLMRLFAVCIVLSLGLMFATTEKTQGHINTVRSILVLLQVTLILLVTPALASGLISSERESGGWQLLQMTPMSALAIVGGKLMSVVVTLLLILLATVPGYFVILFLGASEDGILNALLKSSHTQDIMNIQLSMLLLTAFAVLLSAAMSAVFRRTATATAVSYVVLGVLCIGTMLVRFAEDAPFSHQAVEMVLTVNPLAAALTQINAPMFDDYPLVVPVNRWFMGGGCVLLLLTLMLRVRALTRPQ